MKRHMVIKRQRKGTEMTENKMSYEEPLDLSKETKEELIVLYYGFSRCAQAADSHHLPKASRNFDGALHQIANAYYNMTGKRIEEVMRNKTLQKHLENLDWATEGNKALRGYFGKH